MTYVGSHTRGSTQPQDPTARDSAAFHLLAPITPDYPELPIAESFNWSEALATIKAGVWYLVTFRSVRAHGADVALLTEYDDQAHREALAATGLLFYFKGQLNRRRECLSFCVWQDQQSAQEASRLSLHQAAIGIVGQMYDSYRLERYQIRKEHVSSAVQIERLVNEPVSCP